MKIKRLLTTTFLGLGLTLAVLAILGITVSNVRAATRTVCPPPGGAGCDDTSIQNAVGAADPGDTIIITAGQYAERVTIPKSLTIQGAGIGQTILHGGQNHKLLHITGDNVNVTLIGMTIQDGRSDGSAAGIEIDTDSGTHIISDCLITNNNATDGDAGGIEFGGLNNQLSIVNTTIRNNSAQPGQGGGIVIESENSTVQIMNSAIVNNTAAGSGGGIAFQDSGAGTVVTITNSTISGNQAGNGGGGLSKNPDTGPLYLNNVTIANNTADSDTNGTGVGGGMSVTGTNYIANSLIANNIDNANIAPDCSNGSGISISQGYNLIGDGTGCGWVAGTGDQIGPSGIVTPGIGTLFGLPPYHLVLANSTVISGGNPAAPGSGFPACQASDQAGRTRPVDGRCDIGANEYDSSDIASFNYLPIILKGS